MGSPAHRVVAAIIAACVGLTLPASAHARCDIASASVLEVNQGHALVSSQFMILD